MNDHHSHTGTDHGTADRSRMRILWPDHMGLARGKYLPTWRRGEGTGFCVTTFAMGYDRDLIDAPGGHLLGGLKDVYGTPDPASIRPSWENDATVVAVADLQLGGAPYEVSSRRALQRSLAAWKDLGHDVKVGIELEGYLLAPTPQDPYAKYSNPRSMVYGTGPLGDPSGFVGDVLDTADRCGFAVESANVEFDESQFEFTLRYDDALRAVDDAFLFRLMVREIAISKGLDFTFLGKPFPTVSGSGVHTNFSLVDANGANVMFDASDEHGLSTVARSCLAGLVEHHRALTAIGAPTVNSYRRLQPGSLAGCWANWGVDHRNVANRVPAETGSSMRIESRIGDGSMNLHLGVAAVLEAARLGVSAGAVPGDAYVGDGFEDGGPGAVRGALSLSAALDDLEADTAFVAAFDAELIGNFLANKRHESERSTATGESFDGDTLTEFEVTNYLPYH
ncbi:MAG: glutamine synthetase family protein [Ilumatobacter sp.]|uniref:glutamine synthetase family protein n=1 Tax=Ilumatobacter sp. TaxID=1967498 RepID=UPI003C72B401